MDRPHAVILGFVAAGACTGPACTGPAGRADSGVDGGHPGAQRAVEVISAVARPDRFGDPALAVNGVRGGGLSQGGLDVFRVGLGADDALVLGFAAPVFDGDGPDLAVFENPFVVRGGGVFVDPLVVEVSADCEAFVAFPHAYSGGAAYVADPAAWVGFAGLVPVLLHEEEHPVDPLGPDAGGDPFDLADLDDPGLAAEGARCVRLSPASAHVDPETGTTYPSEWISDGPDIDGVYGRAEP